MTKNNDFAARLERIKDQSDAAQHVTPPSGPSAKQRKAGNNGLTDTLSLLMDPKLVLGAGVALAVAVYALQPVDEEQAAADRAKAAKYSLFKGSGNSRIVYSGEDESASTTDDDYVERIRAKSKEPRTETDRRAQMLLNRVKKDKAGGFEMPETTSDFLNEDGSLTDLTKSLVEKVESN